MNCGLRRCCSISQVCSSSSARTRLCSTCLLAGNSGWRRNLHRYCGCEKCRAICHKCARLFQGVTNSSFGLQEGWASSSPRSEEDTIKAYRATPPAQEALPRNSRGKRRSKKGNKNMSRQSARTQTEQERLTRTTRDHMTTEHIVKNPAASMPTTTIDPNKKPTFLAMLHKALVTRMDGDESGVCAMYASANRER